MNESDRRFNGQPQQPLDNRVLAERAYMLWRDSLQLKVVQSPDILIGNILAAINAACAAALQDETRALYQEIAEEAEQSAFWKFQAMWHRAHKTGRDVDRRDHWRELEAEFETIRIEENKDRHQPENPREIGS